VRLGRREGRSAAGAEFGPGRVGDSTCRTAHRGGGTVPRGRWLVDAATAREPGRRGRGGPDTGHLGRLATEAETGAEERPADSLAALSHVLPGSEVQLVGGVLLG